MAGITSYGAYVPLWRLTREAILKGLRGEKAIRNFDEDTTTMAVAAAIDCLKGQDRETVDGLFFASTTSPYREKQIATSIAAAADLRTNIITADFSGSLRSGTAALRAALDAVKAGSARKVLVVASDSRMGAPGTAFEQNCGDGAAALLVSGEDVAAEVEAWHSVSNEIHDVWRRDDDDFIRSWEERFAYSKGYQETVVRAATALMEESGLRPGDSVKAVLAAPTARTHGEVAKKLGFDPKTQVQPHLFDVMGNTGSAYALMLLVAALEESKPGDRLLLSSYGNGSDTVALRVTERIEKAGPGRGMKGHLDTKRIVDDYRIFLQWRGLLVFEASPTPPGGFLSASALYRDRDQAFPLHGLKCKACSGIHYPPQRVCPKCRAKDQFEALRLSDKNGTVFTFSADNLCPRREAPRVSAIVDFEGGGRMATMMTDNVLEEVAVGMSVEMSFRRLASQDGMHNYGWKSVPLRS